MLRLPNTGGQAEATEGETRIGNVVVRLWSSGAEKGLSECSTTWLPVFELCSISALKSPLEIFFSAQRQLLSIP